MESGSNSAFSVVLQTAPVMLPVLALVAWTLIVAVWMFATRAPAMQKAKIDIQDAKHTRDLSTQLPSNVLGVSDNYNHLHESPTLFYALCCYLTLAGGADNFAGLLAWVYVGLRVVHSIVQGTMNIVAVRFLLFLGSLGVLVAMVVREVMRLLG